MNRSELYYHNYGRKHDITEHMPYLAGLARGKKMIVELGFRTGRSTSAFLFGDSAVQVMAVDIHPCKQPVDVFRNITERFSFVHGDSLKVEIPKCDILFIDSYHSYAQLKAELALHSSKADIIVMHDTETYGIKGEDGKIPGIQQAIREFIEDENFGDMVHFKNNNGLTVISRL